MPTTDSDESAIAVAAIIGDDVEAKVVRAGDRGGRVVLDGVGDRDDAGWPAVHGGQHGRLSAGGQLGRDRLELGCVNACVSEQASGADEHGASRHRRLHAGDRVEPGRGGQGQAAGPGAGDVGVQGRQPRSKPGRRQRRGLQRTFTFPAAHLHLPR